MIAILLAPLPGLVIYLLNARLLRAIDEPSFDERLWRHRRRYAQLAGVSVILLGVFAWRWTPLTLPILSFSCWAGIYPMQRRAFAEERTLGEYLLACARLAFGVTLFWVVVTFEPLIVGTVGIDNWGWVLGALIFWLFIYRSQLLWALHAEPMADERFQAIAEKVGLSPTVYRFGSPKSSFINAFALPDSKRPSVLTSRAMLRHLDADEASAIFAHEVAHLEMSTAARKRMAGRIFMAVIIIGAILPSLLNDALFAEIVWLVAISIGTLLRRSRRQQRETQCDLRAIELCGDPQALIRALTKTHRLGRIPARWDRRYAKRATHPSLEQRVADITSRISHTSPGSADSGLAHSPAS
ncbi:MAG TPA: M48 family metalloprotease [Thermoanaerobaculia bacterium]|nr:M48 family metalloprotease [Thermoanaerobaculia bacterium]